MVRRFTGGSLSLFAVWILLMFGYVVWLVTQSPDVGMVLLLLFYVNLPIALFAILLGLGQLREKNEQVRELYAIDAPSASLAILVGAMATFVVLLFTVALRFEMQPLPMGLIILQALIVVPSEEYSFRFLLPRIMPGHVLRVPGWVLAQGSFAVFHIRAIWINVGVDEILPLVSTLAFIFVFGLFLYLVADAGKKTRFLGLGAAIGTHFVYNLFAFSAGGATGELAFLFGWV